MFSRACMLRRVTPKLPFPFPRRFIATASTVLLKKKTPPPPANKSGISSKKKKKRKMSNPTTANIPKPIKKINKKLSPRMPKSASQQKGAPKLKNATLPRTSYNDLRSEDCFAIIKPYVQYQSYEANTDHDFRSDADKDAFKEELWEIVKGHVIVTQENLPLLDPERVSYSWISAVYNYADGNGKSLEDDVTADFDEKDVEAVVTKLFQTMKFPFTETLAPPIEVKLQAAAFLLERSLSVKDDPKLVLANMYKALLTSKGVKNIKRTNGPLIVDPAMQPLKIADDDEKRGLAQRNEMRDLVMLLKAGRKVSHVLMIGGKRGSGKVHLGVHFAKIALPKDPTRTLTVLTRSGKSADVEELDKRFEQEEDTLDCIKQRNAAVANLLWDRLCRAVEEDKTERRRFLKALGSLHALGSKGESLDSSTYFKRTVLVLDESLLSSRVVMRAMSNSVTEGFMIYMQNLRLERFFGDVDVICCSIESTDSILESGSCPSHYNAIRMSP